MTFEELSAALKRDEIARVYLWHGEEEEIKSRALTQLRRKLLPEGAEDWAMTILETQADAQTIIEACETLPMMAERRLVIVYDSTHLAEKAREKDLEMLSAYIEQERSNAYCLLFYCHGSADMRKKLTKRISQAGSIVSFDPLSEGQLEKYLAAHVKPLGLSIERAAVLLLIEYVGYDLTMLLHEVDKLAAFTEGREAIRASDVQQLVKPSLQTNVFKLMDSIVEGNANQAMNRLHTILADGEHRIGILAMLTRSYRQLMFTKWQLMRGGNSAQIEQQLGISRYVASRLMAQCRPLSYAFLKSAFERCVQADYDIKSGRVREEIALDRILFALSAGKRLDNPNRLRA